MRALELEGLVEFGLGQRGLVAFEQHPALEGKTLGAAIEGQGAVEHLSRLVVHGPAGFVFGILVDRPRQMRQDHAVVLVGVRVFPAVVDETANRIAVRICRIAVGADVAGSLPCR